ncbi:tRNA (guanine(46)-N(7))-methyltransferase TrmB [Wenzhouxiangella limi]|uniref:tRNA (guanine(46)-N(7))-methyltransferase n=1 Tax=Wenzhouxiangella limi TaxID=2707351 RepID=A0A845V8Y0_9GAMM|nr:methyltransferase domain-containing protein [Wenzhouxiangella limi]NDY96611.1 methyltransferase domain-containing protein [Wenzhouxiangella limi]
MAESRVPWSSQPGPHRRLDEVVRRHLSTIWRQPVHGFSQAAFDVVGHLAETDLILDAGCGTAQSTAALARRFPDHTVIGVDRSKSRLARAPDLPGNAFAVRADLADFWRLARMAGWQLRRHYLLYPNPWPKPGHLQRRWHAHPVWPDLLALGGWLELRTNFDRYAEEFARALELAGHPSHLQVLSLAPEAAISAFETKYARSGHRLYRVTADLG